MSTLENPKTQQDKKDGRAVEMHMEKMIDTAIMSVYQSILSKYLPLVHACHQKPDHGYWATDLHNVVTQWQQGGDSTKTHNAKERVGAKKVHLEYIVSKLNDYYFEGKEYHAGTKEPIETKREYTRLRDELVRDINQCLLLVSEFDAYCDEMDKYAYKSQVDRFSPWIHKKSFGDCNLSNYLQSKGITKEDAKTICKGLGASEPEHLAHLDPSDMSRSCIPVSARAAFTLVVTNYKQGRQRRSSTYIKGNAGLHVLLQQLQTMTDDDTFRL
jgi:hypothetical protein